MSDQYLPSYRMQRGRPVGRKRGQYAFTVAVPVPAALYHEMFDECQEEDVATFLSGVRPAYMTDYVRGAILLLNTLLQGATRERVLQFINLPDDRRREVLAHLVFRFAALPNPDHPSSLATPDPAGVDPVEYGKMYRDEAGLAESHDPDEAPLEERDPWNRL